MSKTVVIIPSRLKAKRLPNKPLKIINKKEMILHVYKLAAESGIGKVLVATPDQEIFQLINKNGGNSFVSTKNHNTGTDRVFEAFEKFFSSEPSIIINLQGDMPNLDPISIRILNYHLQKGLCDVATLASSIKEKNEITNENIVKVITKKNIEKTGFSEAIDFERNLNNIEKKFIYHHVGIYGFTKEALIRYVNLQRSKSEMSRNLEQMRALDNNMKIHVLYSNTNPLSVDTEADLEEVKKLMEKKNV